MTALKLKQAGLVWRPALLDCFALPGRDLDGQVFVISDMHATIDQLQGRQVIAFQGASEWALDNLVTEAAVWLPSESQLRQALQSELLAGGRPEVNLLSGIDTCRCTIVWRGAQVSFSNKDAGEAYAAALLHVIRPVGPGWTA
ncbi:MAG: pilus assembly protein CpaE [Chloroflexota bacterium]